MFRIKDLLKGYEFCKKNKLLVTDDSQVIESIGIKPLIIESSCKNIKVTNKIDIR
jgi:2-C-methyl-D-erythritol 4-phosphate cytidylyltransferase